MNTTDASASPPWRVDPALLDATGRAEVRPYDDPEVFARASEEAVAGVRAVLETGWQRWLARRSLDPPPALCTAQPRVTLVGDRPENHHLVGLIRFTFTAEGRQFRGYARGPTTAPMFVVEEARAPSATADEARPRHRWLPRMRTARRL